MNREYVAIYIRDIACYGTELRYFISSNLVYYVASSGQVNRSMYTCDQLMHMGGIEDWIVGTDKVSKYLMIGELLK